MGHIYLMTTIVDRKIIEKYLSLYRENDLHIMYVTLGMGTATNEVMDYFGLDSTEKAVAMSVVEEETWLTVKKQLQKKLQIDAPGGVCIHAQHCGQPHHQQASAAHSKAGEEAQRSSDEKDDWEIIQDSASLPIS